jgi:hypothetical protein
MDDNESILKRIDLSLTPLEMERLKEQLADWINELILNDFQRLAQILYSVDVEESKLKQLLKEEKDKDASKIIASLIIERQLEKLKSRKLYRPFDNMNDEEKW